MKKNITKVISILLVAVMAVTLFGCGRKSENATRVDDMIAAIQTVTLETEAEFEKIDKEIKGLTEEEKAELENMEKFETDKQSLAQLKLDRVMKEKWINVKDCDAYKFEKDGKGKHDDVSVTYSLDDKKLVITEGAGNTESKEFSIDDSENIVKIIPAEGNTYYVQESEYEAIGEEIRKESISILTSSETWVQTNTSRFTGYLMFQENNTGWFVMVGNTYGTSWEMTDNDSVKVTIFAEPNNYSNTYDIKNNDGVVQLEDSAGNVWVPKK